VKGWLETVRDVRRQPVDAGGLRMSTPLLSPSPRGSGDRHRRADVGGRGNG